MQRSGVQQALQSATAHHRAGRLQQALVACQDVLRQQPDHPDALHLLGMIQHQTGRHVEALGLIQRAIELEPRIPAYYHTLAAALCSLGRLPEAIRVYQRITHLLPAVAQAHNDLAAALGLAQRFDDAIAACHRALELEPAYPEALSNLGNLLRQTGRLEEAAAMCRQAIQLKTGNANAYINLALALRGLGRQEEAKAAAHRATEVEPLSAEAHLTYAIQLLAMGDLENGWREYEWRWRAPSHGTPARDYPQPKWDGTPLAGRTIFLYSEQGLGDTIQFVRYASLLAADNGRVVVGCPSTLKGVVQSVQGIDEVVTDAQQVPAFDVHCALMSLPLAFRTRPDSIPARVPYVRPNEDLVKAWREEVALDLRKLKVGLVWAGGPKYNDDWKRSVLLESFAPLTQVTGVAFYSLQKGEASKQAETASAGMNLRDLTARIRDFSDTAALVANLDLVISVDTSVAHLAGAMGQRVWTLIPFVSDWRWLLEREESPWYPTMRLFRQPSIGDWGSVFERVAAELARVSEEFQLGAAARS